MNSKVNRLRWQSKMSDGFPTFEVEDVRVPKVLIGINPFLGYSHFSEARSNYFKRIFKDVKAISDVIVKATELGVTGIYPPADEKISKALRQVEQRTGIKMTVVGTTYYTFDLAKIEKEINILKDMDRIGEEMAIPGVVIVEVSIYNQLNVSRCDVDFI